MSDAAYVNLTVAGGIATIEFFHPKGNSLPSAMLEDITQKIYSAENDERAKVIVIQSGGEKAFCAGASFDELSTIHDAESGREFFIGFGNIINAIRKSSKFVIARVHGKCVGGGVGIAAAADYTLAMEGADVKLSELAIGIGPFVIGPAVERKIGKSAFTALAIDAQMWRNADWARRKGLYAELHPNRENLDEAVHRLAESLTHYSPEAMKYLKRTFWEGTEHWDNLLASRAEISGKLLVQGKALLNNK
jgi:methylglutaconyl-CoA hydratase